MAKISILFLLSFFLSASVFSQAKTNRSKRVTLRGTVYDQQTGEALPAATIYLPDDRTGAVADGTGRFIIADLPPGHHVAEITHSGYGTLVEHIEFENDTTVIFRLSPTVVENQAVIVTGVSTATSIRKSPIPVSSIRRNELLQNSSTNIVDALTRVPGLAQLSTGPAISKPFIRGLGANRVVIVNEGVRQEGQQWGDEHGVEIDEMSVNRVEVLKGPASLMYGSDALAGVVHFISNIPLAEGIVRGNLNAQYQFNPNLYSFNGNVAGNRGGFNWNLYGSLRSAKDYRNEQDGRVFNSRFNEGNLGGYFGLNRSWGYSHLLFSRFRLKSGIVEGDRDPVTGEFLMNAGTPRESVATRADLLERSPRVPYQEVIHQKITSDNNFILGKHRLKLNLAFQQNHRKEFGNPDVPVIPELFFDLKTINYNFQWQLPEFREWHTTLGLNGMKQWNRNRAEEAIIPEYGIFDLGLFLFSQRFFSRSTLSGGIRFDLRDLASKEMREAGDLKFAALERSFSNLSGSIGLSQELTDKITLKLNLARGFRAPTVAELLSNGAHEGTDRYEYGRSSLSSERSLQTDLGGEMNFDHFNLGLAFFYNRINDFIFYQKLLNSTGGDSMVNVDGDLVRAFQFSQQDAALAGFEFNLDIHPHPFDWLHIENSVSFVRGRFKAEVDGDRDLPLIPAPRVLSELRADLGKAGKSFSEVYVKIEVDHNFSQSHPFTGFETESRTSSYTLLHFGAGAAIQHRKTKRSVISFNLSVQNLTDRSYQSHLSRLKYTDVNPVTGRQGVFNMGRNISVRVNVPLHFTR